MLLMLRYEIALSALSVIQVWVTYAFEARQKLEKM